MKERGQARRRVAALRKLLQAFIDKVEVDLVRMHAGLTPYQPVGILLQQSEPTKLRATMTSRPIYVVATGNDTRPEFEQIGRMEEGELQLEKQTVQKFPQGTLLFSRLEPSKN